jgi:coproporphyrinogen III oxidase-like Fe-S oxidoreductase
MWEVTQEVTAGAGFRSYEVSNHAKEGCESRHNLIYWQGGDYVGIGPGAHGRVTLGGVRFATEAPKAPVEWLRRVEQIGSGEGVREALTSEDHLAEFVMMGLRLREGVRLDRLQALCGGALDSNIKALCDIGMVELDDQRLWVTEAGRPVLNAVLRQLLGA